MLLKRLLLHHPMFAIAYRSVRIELILPGGFSPWHVCSSAWCPLQLTDVLELVAPRSEHRTPNQHPRILMLPGSDQMSTHLGILSPTAATQSSCDGTAPAFLLPGWKCRAFLNGTIPLPRKYQGNLNVWRSGGKMPAQ